MARTKRFLIILFVVIGIFVLLWPHGVVIYRTSYIISHIVPAVPEWFEWGSYEVEVREIEPFDMYLPRGKDETSFVIFFPGFNPDGARDPRMVNLAQAFAGAGIGVAVPDSENIKQQKFSREDIDLIKDAFYFLREQPYVNSDHIGLSGFSIAGSYVLRAAAELGTEPLFVHSLGAYYDLAELFDEIKMGKAIYQDSERSWEPSSLSKEISQNEVNAQITKEETDNLSPAPVIRNIKTRVYLMHDKNDDRIPVEESRKIRDALPENIFVSYSEFSLFQHVTPRNFLSFDILKLSGQMFGIMKLLL